MKRVGCIAAGRRGRAAALAVALLLVAGVGSAQRPPATAGSAATGAASAAEDGIAWQALTPAQREILAPLASEWPRIDSPRKRKWVALAGRFRSLPADEQARISARMTEWARLTPSERAEARIQYQETRGVPLPDRQARWQAYQQLPPDQRQALVRRAASSAASASATAPGPSRSDARSGDGSDRAARPLADSTQSKANVVPSPGAPPRPRQVAPTLVQVGPGATTRSIGQPAEPPAHQQPGMPKVATTPEFVNKATLLPRRGAQAAGVGVPPAASTPAASRPR